MKTLITLTFFTFLACQVLAQSPTSKAKQAFNQAQKQSSKLTDHDRLQIAVQKICPVMGAELGSMGEPIKIKLGEQHAYLCCKSCVGKKVKREHWKTIQANMANAQATCPIMGKPVTADMQSTVVEGQQVFVCCPPCIPKITADPKTSLKKVNASYAAFVKAEAQVKSDQIHAAAQQICPVSGKPLGSMGKPFKVQVGEEHAFLCCEGCQSKKISAELWKTVQANLATAQCICPVMKKPVDANMKSAVVNGRKIFVCCPPCIDKIKDKPDEFVSKLDSQISAHLARKKKNGKK